MLKRILAVLTALALLFAACAAAETVESENSADPATMTLQDIEALNGAPVAVYTENNRVTFVGGTCTDRPVNSFEDAAAVIGSMLPLLGGDRYTAFEPRRVLTDPAGNRYYVFQQVMDYTLVQGGAVKVITDREGDMIGLTASVIPVSAENGEEASAGAVTAEQAESLVLAHERDLGNAEPDVIKGQTERIILPVERNLDIEADVIDSRYVWAVFTTNPSASGSGTGLPYLAHYVTMDGEYLYSLPTIVPGDAAGRAGYDAGYVFEFMEPVDYTGYVDYSDGTEHEISVTLMRDTRTGMYYLGNIERKIVVADCWEFLYNGGRVVLEYSPDNLEWDQTSLMSLYHYCQAWDYYSAIGWRGGDGEETPVIILKDFCDSSHRPVNNAAYAGRFYGWQTFLSSSVNDFAQCLDVGAHEFTHCVTGTVMTYNAYMNDYGAINEAISDIHGNLCEMMAGSTSDTDWLIAENSGNPIRSMSDPHKFQQPEYVWDICYRSEVKDPTATNDHGGVHTNSSLLNRVAYLLCTEGGMALEDARTFWFTADCAMVPGTDYAQLRALLPWVMEITGMESYLDALEKAADATRLGETGLPDPVEEDKALLILDLPDSAVFNNGKWLLQFASIDIDRISRFISTVKEDLESGNLDGYPELIREMFTPAPTPDPRVKEEKENKPGFLEALAKSLTELLSEKKKAEPSPKPEKGNSKLTGLLEWLRGSLQGVLYSGMGSAGADGHTVRIMSLPGRVFPLLTYVSMSSGNTVIEQMNSLVFINGRWFDLSVLVNEPGPDGKPDAAKAAENLLGSDFVTELIKLLTSGRNPADILNALALDVRGGETVVIPSEGLEKIDLSSGIRDKQVTRTDEPHNRKSRPKLSEPAPQ